MRMIYFKSPDRKCSSKMTFLGSIFPEGNPQCGAIQYWDIVSSIEKFVFFNIPVSSLISSENFGPQKH
jgi:hypothetical protein